MMLQRPVLVASNVVPELEAIVITGSSRSSAARVGSSTPQTPHQVAQKCTSTGLPR